MIPRQLRRSAATPQSRTYRSRGTPGRWTRRSARWPPEGCSRSRAARRLRAIRSAAAPRSIPGCGARPPVLMPPSRRRTGIMASLTAAPAPIAATPTEGCSNRSMPPIGPSETTFTEPAHHLHPRPWGRYREFSQRRHRRPRSSERRPRSPPDRPSRPPAIPAVDRARPGCRRNRSAGTALMA